MTRGRVAAWLAVVGLCGVIAPFGFGLANGGIGRVIAWLLGGQILPVLALLWWLPAVAWLVWRRQATVPHACVLGLSTACLVPAVWGFGLVPVQYPFASLETTGPAATVRLPTDAEMVVGWGGDTLATNYHGIDPAQRWAYDLLIEPAAHGGSALAGYGCYGVDVLAPAAGTVTLAVDGLPDAVPGQHVLEWRNPAGNHVSLRLDTDTYLVLAHLQPGSVAVRAGDRVVEGQVLGRCGNSGNTSEPHIHLHHQRQDPAVLGLLAEGLPLWFRDVADREGPSMPVGGIEVVGEVVRLIGDRVQHQVR